MAFCVGHVVWTLIVGSIIEDLVSGLTNRSASREEKRRAKNVLTNDLLKHLNNSQKSYAFLYFICECLNLILSILNLILTNKYLINTDFFTYGLDAYNYYWNNEEQDVMNLVSIFYLFILFVFYFIILYVLFYSFIVFSRYIEMRLLQRRSQRISQRNRRSLHLQAQ